MFINALYISGPLLSPLLTILRPSLQFTLAHCCDVNSTFNYFFGLACCPNCPLNMRLIYNRWTLAYISPMMIVYGVFIYLGVCHHHPTRYKPQPNSTTAIYNLDLYVARVCPLASNPGDGCRSGDSICKMIYHRNHCHQPPLRVVDFELFTKDLQLKTC